MCSWTAAERVGRLFLQSVPETYICLPVRLMCEQQLSSTPGASDIAAGSSLCTLTGDVN